MSESPVPQSLNPLAIASLVCGVLSVLCACVCYGFPFNLLALLLGVIAVFTTDATQGGKPFAYAGIGLSLVSMLLAAALFFLGMAGAVMGPILETM